ncbi:MAG: hypothetical protein QNJ73_08955 [Gammaproteobacteria bacterium]|nr:hypothetical protein [Gammaproteobacteria bacterium]
MTKKHIAALLCVWLIVAPTKVLACLDHMSIDPEALGFFGGAFVRMVGLAHPAPVFELEHPRMVRPVIGERSELIVNYSRPFFSKNVRLEVEGTPNVQLHLEEIALDDRDGTVTIPFHVSDSGFDLITLTVSGTHKGEMVSESKRITVQGSGKSPRQELRVSQR